MLNHIVEVNLGQEIPINLCTVTIFSEYSLDWHAANGKCDCSSNRGHRMSTLTEYLAIPRESSTSLHRYTHRHIYPHSPNLWPLYSVISPSSLGRSGSAHCGSSVGGGSRVLGSVGSGVVVVVVVGGSVGSGVVVGGSVSGAEGGPVRSGQLE